MKTILHLVAVVAASLLAFNSQAQSLEGTYQCQGAAPGGAGAYLGTVGIRKTGASHAVNWTLGAAGNYAGSGLVSGKVLAAAYGGGNPYGLVVYQVDGGKLSGSWLVGGSRIVASGVETIEGPRGLSGKYQITTGKSSQGGNYTGTVTITKTGETYAVSWTLPNESYSGVGILHGDLLVVGWGVGRGYGVVAYEIEAGKLKGKWAAAGSEALGTETLTK